MNALDELLDGEQGWLDIERLREATSTALLAVRHDRRVERLTGDQALAIGVHLIQTPDIRTLARSTVPSDPELIEEQIERQHRYVNRFLLEVVHLDSLADEGVRRLQRVGVARGAQVRVTEVPFRLHLYDRSFAMVAADFDRSLAGALAIREPGLIAAFTRLHARLWQQGERWEPSGVDLVDVLAELLAGATDEAGAQRLCVSLRTYRRKVQELFELLGVKSRFQAGAVAEHRRYLDLVRPPASAPLDNGDLYDEVLSRVR